MEWRGIGEAGFGRVVKRSMTSKKTVTESFWTGRLGSKAGCCFDEFGFSVCGTLRKKRASRRHESSYGTRGCGHYASVSARGIMQSGRRMGRFLFLSQLTTFYFPRNLRTLAIKPKQTMSILHHPIVVCLSTFPFLVSMNSRAFLAPRISPTLQQLLEIPTQVSRYFKLKLYLAAPFPRNVCKSSRST